MRRPLTALSDPIVESKSKLECRTQLQNRERFSSPGLTGDRVDKVAKDTLSPHNGSELTTLGGL